MVVCKPPLMRSRRLARDRSGAGQHLDVSMQAAVVGCPLWTSSYSNRGNPTHTGTTGEKHQLIVERSSPERVIRSSSPVPTATQ